jgi:hypothetical protein
VWAHERRSRRTGESWRDHREPQRAARRRGRARSQAGVPGTAPAAASLARLWRRRKCLQAADPAPSSRSTQPLRPDTYPLAAQHHQPQLLLPNPTPRHESLQVTLPKESESLCCTGFKPLRTPAHSSHYTALSAVSLAPGMNEHAPETGATAQQRELRGSRSGVDSRGAVVVRPPPRVGSEPVGTY